MFLFHTLIKKFQFLRKSLVYGPHKGTVQARFVQVIDINYRLHCNKFRKLLTVLCDTISLCGITKTYNNKLIICSIIEIMIIYIISVNLN